mmetsp:Transcript_53602/g.170479  ORF Transcript_53602/g.170479 Transcript_53602/m.170479 type:complete len:117 (+) Transcript_53602:328-678(+)
MSPVRCAREPGGNHSGRDEEISCAHANLEVPGQNVEVAAPEGVARGVRRDLRAPVDVEDSGEGEDGQEGGTDSAGQNLPARHYRADLWQPPAAPFTGAATITAACAAAAGSAFLVH